MRSFAIILASLLAAAVIVLVWRWSHKPVVQVYAQCLLEHREDASTCMLAKSYVFDDKCGIDVGYDAAVTGAPL